ncbi:MAG: hypothetical protein ABR587_16170 [Candidatus Binatia bacterium]
MKTSFTTRLQSRTRSCAAGTWRMPAARCAAALLCVLAMSGRAEAATTAQLEEFRGDFGIFLDELSALGSQARSIDQNTATAFESLSRAREMLHEATTEDLAPLQEAMARNPEAWEVPAQLRSRLTLAGRTASRETIGIKANGALCADDSGQIPTCDDCPSQTAMGVKDEIITGAVVLGLEAVWTVLSDGWEIPVPIIGGCIRTPSPPKIILGIAMYAVKMIELSIAGANAISNDCEAQYRNRVTGFNLDDTVTSRASASAVAALLQSIKDFQAEAIRFDVEANMIGDSSRTALSLFQLPAQHGGYLEVVRALVVESIDELQSPGDPMDDARRYLNGGDVNYGSEKWVEAYELYRSAYRVAVSDNPAMARRRIR